MMQSYVFEAPVSFSEHHFQARLGDVCVYNRKTKHLVIYRDENIITQFDISNTAIEAMEARKWLCKVTAPKKDEEFTVVSDSPKTEKVELEVKKEEVEDIKEEVEDTSNNEEVSDSTEDEEGEDPQDEQFENPESTDVVKEKRKGGRPKKVKN